MSPRRGVALLCVIVLSSSCSSGEGDRANDVSTTRPADPAAEPTGSTSGAGGSDAADAVRIADDAFGFVEDGSLSYETVLVSGDFDREHVTAALNRAAGRFMLVTEDGTEHSSDESVQASGLYSPNYVADPRPGGDGITLYVDCKGVIPPPMGATFRRILREELERAGVGSASVVPVLE